MYGGRGRKTGFSGGGMLVVSVLFAGRLLLTTSLGVFTVRFTELLKMVQEVPDFAEDPSTSNEGKLESIQMAWLEEYKDLHKG